MHTLSKKQLIAIGALAMLLLSLGSMLGFWGYYHWWLGVDLKNQSLVASLPPRLEATVEATKPFKIYAQGAVAVEVPLQQVIVAPLVGNFPAQVKLNIPIPLHFSVPFKATIPINSWVDIDTDTSAILPHLPSMPLKIRLPIQLDVPVNTLIPINTTLQFHYAGPLDMLFNQRVSVPMHTQLNSTLALDQYLQVNALGRFAVGVYPQDRLNVQLQAAIRQPFKQLRFDADQSAQ